MHLLDVQHHDPHPVLVERKPAGLPNINTSVDCHSFFESGIYSKQRINTNRAPHPTRSQLFRELG